MLSVALARVPNGKVEYNTRGIYCHWSAAKNMRPFRLKQRVGSYIILELVGQHDATALYLAIHSERGERFWLLRAGQQTEHLTEQVLRRELFTLDGETLCVVPISALSLAALASFVHVIDLAFLGWRWAGLAESLH